MCIFYAQYDYSFNNILQLPIKKKKKTFQKIVLFETVLTNGQWITEQHSSGKIK